MVVSMTKKMKIKLLFYCICFMNDLDGYVAIPDVHDDDTDNAFFYFMLEFFLAPHVVPLHLQLLVQH